MQKLVAVILLMAFGLGGCTIVELGSDDPGGPGEASRLVSGPGGPQSSQVVLSVTGSSIANFVKERAAQALDRRDRQFLRDAAQRAVQSGEDTVWRNNQTGNRGRVTPGPVYIQTSGKSCRNFTHTFWRDHEKRAASGTACELEDGSWEILG